MSGYVITSIVYIACMSMLCSVCTVLLLGCSRRVPTLSQHHIRGIQINGESKLTRGGQGHQEQCIVQKSKTFLYYIYCDQKAGSLARQQTKRAINCILK